MKHAEIVTKDQLWRGVMNTTPVGLQNATFFVVGKMLCERCDKNMGLQLSQLKRFDDRYVYYENVSKNRNGSFKQEQSCSLKAFTRSRST